MRELEARERSDKHVHSLEARMEQVAHVQSMCTQLREELRVARLTCEGWRADAQVQSARAQAAEDALAKLQVYRGTIICNAFRL